MLDANLLRNSLLNLSLRGEIAVLSKGSRGSRSLRLCTVPLLAMEEKERIKGSEEEHGLMITSTFQAQFRHIFHILRLQLPYRSPTSPLLIFKIVFLFKLQGISNE